MKYDQKINIVNWIFRVLFFFWIFLFFFWMVFCADFCCLTDYVTIFWICYLYFFSVFFVVRLCLFLLVFSIFYFFGSMKAHANYLVLLVERLFFLSFAFSFFFCVCVCVFCFSRCKFVVLPCWNCKFVNSWMYDTGLCV